MADALVLVLGGTGHHGREIVARLVERGARTRVMSRDADAARALLGGSVEVIRGDITNAADVGRSLQGATALVVAVSAISAKLVRRLWAIEHDAVLEVFAQAARCGVRRVVYISAYQPVPELIERYEMEIGRVKLAVEAALSASDLDWTVLGLPPSMELFFAFLRGSRMIVPGGGTQPFPTVSARDVGAIAAEAALRGDLARQRFRVTGPEAISCPEAARRLSAALGREIRWHALPLLIPRIAAAVAGPVFPFLPHIVSALRLLNAFPSDLAAQVPADHQRLLSTFDFTPTTLEDEARRHSAEGDMSGDAGRRKRRWASAAPRSTSAP